MMPPFLLFVGLEILESRLPPFLFFPSMHSPLPRSICVTLRSFCSHCLRSFRPVSFLLLQLHSWTPYPVFSSVYALTASFVFLKCSYHLPWKAQASHKLLTWTLSASASLPYLARWECHSYFQIHFRGPFPMKSFTSDQMCVLCPLNL